MTLRDSTSSIILTVLEVVMAYHIPRRYGFQLSISEIGFAATAIFGASALLKLGVSTLLEFVPVLGWFIAKPGIAFLFVIIIGVFINQYFKDKKRLSQSK